MNKMKGRPGTKVLIDKIEYSSLKKAAEYLNIKCMTLSNWLKKGKVSFNSHIIEKANELKEEKETKVNTIQKAKRRKHTVKSCPVKCITTGEYFESINEAARRLNVNAWTMGIKMEAAGKFIDKEGKEYIRLRPMDTNGNYKKGYKHISPEVNRQVKAYNKNTFNTELLLDNEEKEVETTKPVNEIDLLENVAQILVKHKKYEIVAKIYETLAKMS